MDSPPTDRALRSPELGTAEVARVVGVSAARIRGWVRAGLCRPQRRGRAWRFGFGDVVVLKTVSGLAAARVSLRRIRRAIQGIERHLAGHRPLSSVRIYADRGRVVVRDEGTAWLPESGQGLLLFDLAAVVRAAAAGLLPAAPETEQRRADESPGREEARSFFRRAVQAEGEDVRKACFLYRRALYLDPDFEPAYANLARLVEELGDVSTAADLCSEALRRNPTNDNVRRRLSRLR